MSFQKHRFISDCGHTINGVLLNFPCLRSKLSNVVFVVQFDAVNLAATKSQLLATSPLEAGNILSLLLSMITILRSIHASEWTFVTL